MSHAVSAAGDPCPGCGARFPSEEGPVHRYLESSPGCWRRYGEVLTREYEDPGYGRVHRLTVDAYAVQHPGHPSPQTIQSAAVHLMSLCAVLERDVPLARAGRVLASASRIRERFVWLEPPPDRGRVTVAEVLAAGDAPEHVRRVRAWAESAWVAWAEQHATIRGWLDELG